MNKLVWQDYWKGFAWSNVKAYFKENKSFAFVCFVACFITIPNYISEKTFGEIDRIYSMAKYFCVVLPFAFAAVAIGVTMIDLPKAMYMSPMRVDERKEYVKKKWKLSVLVPNVVNADGMIIGLFVGMELWTVVFFVVHFGLLSEGLMLFVSKNANRFDVTQDNAYGGYGIFFILSTILVHIVAVAVVIKDGSMDMLWLAILWGVLILLELPLFIKLMTYKKKLILSLVNYEATYDVGSY